MARAAKEERRTHMKIEAKNNKKKEKDADMEVEEVEEGRGIEEEEWRKMEEYAKRRMGNGTWVFRRQM